MTAGQPVPKVSVLTEETAEIAVAETVTFMVAPPARPAVRLPRESGSPCRKASRPYLRERRWCCGQTSRCAPATLDQGARPQMAYFHRYSAGARCVPPTVAAKYLTREDVCGRQNAVARQRFCPLQGIVFAIFLKEGRPKRSIRPLGR